MDTEEAKAALKEDAERRSYEAQEVFKAAMKEIKAMGFMVVPTPVTVPTGGGVFQLTAQLKFVEIPVE